MKENIKFQFVRMPLSSDDGSIKCVGVVARIPIGLDVYKLPSGGYDVALFIYDYEMGDWMAVGDAERVYSCATKEAALRCGIVDLLTEVQAYFR